MTGPLLPHLFQRKIGWRREIISTKVLYRLLSETLHRAGLVDRVGEPLRYMPHDFRRIFATDAVPAAFQCTSPRASSATTTCSARTPVSRCSRPN
ncbi:hypothetical protein [Actinophytocola gossypii]|uniref:Tyr recombinase domain-containing protein n=1 Tax=Actinophytocola gossypii TaxID=2812003 RepID=A0ABT2JJ80_9PSEU|nr:hypothetical protein [Actinophytocola gossypii]MCT2587584.1 hypothetical protein [Actinophytocola gossypii]